MPRCSWISKCLLFDGLNSGQQDGRRGRHGSAGGHSGHSCLRGELVWKHGCQAASHGVCASGESKLPLYVKQMILLRQLEWDSKP